MAGRIPYLFHLPNATSRLVPFGPSMAVRLAAYIQFRPRQSGKLAAKAPAYSSISVGPPRPAVIGEMFHKLVSRSGHAVTASVMPPNTCHRRCRFPVVTLLYRWRESIDLGMRPVHPCIFLGCVESAVLDLTITDDLPQAVCRRSIRLVTPLSMDSTL
jgi:hypothetical protein